MSTLFSLPEPTTPAERPASGDPEAILVDLNPSQRAAVVAACKDSPHPSQKTPAWRRAPGARGRCCAGPARQG